MNEQHWSTPQVYAIRFQGHLDLRRARMFEGLEMVREPGGETVLRGPVLDQAALHGILTVMSLPTMYVSFGEEFGWRAYLQQKSMPLGPRKAVLLVATSWLPCPSFSFRAPWLRPPAGTRVLRSGLPTLERRQADKRSGLFHDGAASFSAGCPLR